MRILIVGAGAVGQVYGWHLRAGGAHVAFYVRPKYVEALKGGFDVYPHIKTHHRWEAPELFSTPEAAGAARWDQVWLTVSSTALAGPWLDALCEAVAPAVIVCFQPGMKDGQLLAEKVGKDRVVMGMIPFIAWQAPLPGETLDPPGVAWYLPPFSPTPLSGPLGPVSAAVAALKAGGLAARAVDNVSKTGALGSGVLNPLIAHLELAGWSFARFRAEQSEAAVETAREAMTIAAAWHGTPVPALAGLLRPWMARLITRLAPIVMPFNIEVYLKYHFTKVGDQTRQSIGVWINEGRARGLPVAALERTAASLPTWGKA